jgi:hypothetical protein
MWHYQRRGEPPSSVYTPRRIPDSLIIEGAEVWLGKRKPFGTINFEAILKDFDRLLILYRFVENEGGSERQTVSVSVPFETRRGFLPKALSAIKRQIQKQQHVILRQNKLQNELCRQLKLKYGGKYVISEFPTAFGRVDVAVDHGKVCWFYEIKTADSARECLRESLGQLFEYAFWRGAPKVTRLIVVGEHAIDKECRVYLKLLKERFSLPVEYKRIIVK